VSEFKRYFRQGYCEARPYIVGEALTGIVVHEEYVEEVAKIGGGMILRHPESHHQWYMPKEKFDKNYALVEDVGAPESDLEVVEFVICDDDENVHKAEDPTNYQNTLTLLSALRSADQDVQFTLYAKIQA
jgi:hypothetical protein